MYQEFVTKVKEHLQQKLGADYEVTIHSATKVNDTHKCGITIKEKGLNISPTIYLEEFYSRYEDDSDLADIILSIINLYNKVKFDKDWDIKQIADFQNVKDKIIFHLINFEMNELLLKNVPYLEYLDLAIVFRVIIELHDKGMGNILVTNELLKMWGVSKEELFEIAKENTPKMFPMEFKPMQQVIEEIIGKKINDEDMEESYLHVLSNQKKSFGSSLILYENVLEQVADILQDNLILIPSSIHEWVILPRENMLCETEMNEMITEINETQVADEDILSNHFYYYDRTKKELK